MGEHLKKYIYNNKKKKTAKRKPICSHPFCKRAALLPGPGGGRGGKEGGRLASPGFFVSKPTTSGKLRKRSQSLIFWKQPPLRPQTLGFHKRKHFSCSGCWRRPPPASPPRADRNNAPYEPPGQGKEKKKHQFPPPAQTQPGFHGCKAFCLFGFWLGAVVCVLVF